MDPWVEPSFLPRIYMRIIQRAFKTQTLDSMFINYNLVGWRWYQNFYIFRKLHGPRSCTAWISHHRNGVLCILTLYPPRVHLLIPFLSANISEKTYEPVQLIQHHTDFFINDSRGYESHISNNLGHLSHLDSNPDTQLSNLYVDLVCTMGFSFLYIL